MSGDLKTGGEETQGSLGSLRQTASLPPHGPKVRTHLAGVQGDPAVRESPLLRQRTLLLPGCLPGQGGDQDPSGRSVCVSQQGVVASYPHSKQAVTPGTFGDAFTFTSFST